MDEKKQEAKAQEPVKGIYKFIVPLFALAYLILNRVGIVLSGPVFLLAVILIGVLFSKLTEKRERTGKKNRQDEKSPPPLQNRTVPVRAYSDSLREEEDARDRQRRLRQLDDFLKNGIIDREEYRVLRRRYER